MEQFLKGEEESVKFIKGLEVGSHKDCFCKPRTKKLTAVGTVVLLTTWRSTKESSSAFSSSFVSTAVQAQPTSSQSTIRVRLKQAMAHVRHNETDWSQQVCSRPTILGIYNVPLSAATNWSGFATSILIMKVIMNADGLGQ